MDIWTFDLIVAAVLGVMAIIWVAFRIYDLYIESRVVSVVDTAMDDQFNRIKDFVHSLDHDDEEDEDLNEHFENQKSARLTEMLEEEVIENKKLLQKVSHLEVELNCLRNATQPVQIPFPPVDEKVMERISELIGNKPPENDAPRNCDKCGGAEFKPMGIGIGDYCVGCGRPEHPVNLSPGESPPEIDLNLFVEKKLLDEVYRERNRLVALISHIFQGSIEQHVDGSPPGNNVVIVDLPTGQASWHIHDSDLEMFSHLERDQDRIWDGHSTEEKYKRIEAMLNTDWVVVADPPRARDVLQGWPPRFQLVQPDPGTPDSSDGVEDVVDAPPDDDVSTEIYSTTVEHTPPSPD